MVEYVDRVEHGEGWAAGSLNAMGEGPGFRKVRHELGVTSMGANALVLPPGLNGRAHHHEQQEEIYFVHEGEVRFDFGDGASRIVEAGGLVRVDAHTNRQLTAVSAGNAVVLVVGAKGGYIGRDGVIVDPL